MPMQITFSGPIASFFGLPSVFKILGVMTSGCRGARSGCGRPRSSFSRLLPADAEGSNARQRAGLGVRNERAGLGQRRDGLDDHPDEPLCSAGERLESEASQKSGE